jgi:oligopeptidase B
MAVHDTLDGAGVHSDLDALFRDRSRQNDLVTLGEPAPTLLYGYGSYEHAIDPAFGIPRLSLLDRGMVFAAAPGRGGGGGGRAGPAPGKKMHKRPTVDDLAVIHL